MSTCGGGGAAARNLEAVTPNHRAVRISTATSTHLAMKNEDRCSHRERAPCFTDPLSGLLIPSSMQIALWVTLRASHSGKIRAPLATLQQVVFANKGRNTYLQCMPWMPSSAARPFRALSNMRPSRGPQLGEGELKSARRPARMTVVIGNVECLWVSSTGAFPGSISIHVPEEPRDPKARQGSHNEVRSSFVPTPRSLYHPDVPGFDITQSNHQGCRGPDGAESVGGNSIGCLVMLDIST